MYSSITTQLASSDQDLDMEREADNVVTEGCDGVEDASDVSSDENTSVTDSEVGHNMKEKRLILTINLKLKNYFRLLMKCLKMPPSPRPWI